MKYKKQLYKVVTTTSWLVAATAVVYIAVALHGGKTASAEETNTLVCTPASQNTTYTLPSSTTWRSVEESSIGDTSWSGHQVGQALITDGNDQYAGYYNADRRMTIAHRTLGTNTWEKYSIPDAQAVIGWDSHNYITMAVDSVGNLHVSGNMHGGPIKYWKTSTPRQISSLQKISSLVDPALESSVTYPIFMKDKAGNMIYNYRNGESGSGQVYFNKFDPVSNTWSALLQTDLFDGLAYSPDRSSYFSLTPTPNADGYYEMTWMWRDTYDVASNSRLSYARSSDLQHWETINGTPLTLPLTYNTAGVIIDDIPENGGLFNGQERIGVDADGKTTVTYSKYDASGYNQIYVARANAQGVWQSTKVTQWTGTWHFWGGGTLSNRINLNATAVLPDGQLRLTFGCAGSTPGSGTIILNNDTLAPTAQVGVYNVDTYPGVIFTSTTTTPPSASRRTTNAFSNDTRYMLKWQSQGTNQDQPFASWPAAQPITVFTLLANGVAHAPTDLQAEFTQDRTAATITWQAPTNNGGYEITDYLIEYTSNQGESWTTYQHAASPLTTATIGGLDPEGIYAFRVSAVTSFGVGNAVSNLVIDNDPTIPTPDDGVIGGGGTLPTPPNTGSFLPSTVHPIVIVAFGVSSSILVLIAARRRFDA